MLMKHSGYPAQGVEVLDGHRRLVGLDAGDHLEMHHISKVSVHVDGDHATSVAGRQHGGHSDIAVAPQCVQPVEFGFDFMRQVVVLPVHPQDRTGTRTRVLDGVGGVLRQIQQAQRRMRGEVILGKRTFGDGDIVLDHPVTHLWSRPSISVPSAIGAHHRPPQCGPDRQRPGGGPTRHRRCRG